MLLKRVPGGKFICLYRHPMDVIASGVEACPWGLANYGFEPQLAGAPGNSVLALARYWTDHTAAILAVQDKYPRKLPCGSGTRTWLLTRTASPGDLRVSRLPPVPGISALCFSRERRGPAPGDFKIWNTSQITGESVGRGWVVPANLIPGAVDRDDQPSRGQAGLCPRR